MAPRILTPGTMLSGRYQIGDVIGESDLSIVYGATDSRNSAPVALKVFDANVKARAAALSEYQSQARQASGLGVEGIARAYDFGIDANTGLAFSTAERINWASLDRRVAAQGPLGIAELSRGLAVLARALDAAHAARLLHRDLKPQNVFISPNNPEWVRLTDFGMSAVRRGAPEALGWGGPPGYTPPDAVDANAQATPGVDLFALGVIAFFALTRGTPFRSLRVPGFDPNTHWTELNQPLFPISERAKEIGVALHPAFDAWFARALAIAPQDRFRSAGEMARELSAIADQASARGGGGPRSMPGIAAAIAQPLVFQPEPSPASLGLGATVPLGASSPVAGVTTGPAAAVVTAGPAPMSPPTLLSTPEDVAGVPKKGSKAPLFIGLGVLLFAGLAAAGYVVVSKSRESASAEAVPSASAAALAPAPSASAVPTGPARARFSCKPEACEWIVCDSKNLTNFDQEVEMTPGNHDCSASKLGLGSKSLSFTALPGQVVEVVFDLPPLPASAQQKAAASASAAGGAPPAAAAAPAPKPAAAPAPKTGAASTTKPATKEATTKEPVAKPASKPSTKKKCGTFIPCK